MITGPAGSGKSTLGRALAERLGAATVDLDDAAADVVARYRALHSEVTEAEALSLLREERYAVVAESARDLITEGQVPAVVLIAPFTSEISSLERWQSWVRDLGVPEERAHLVWLLITPDERLRRLAARGATRDAELVATGGVPEAVAPPVPAVVVDAGLSVAEQVDLVVQRFGNG
jgi:predicted kinase